jgi:predicted nucleic acid-binding protein
VTELLVWDASALHHAALADRLDVLQDLARGSTQRPWRHVTTAAVLDELSSHGLNSSAFAWLQTAHVDGLDELHCLVTWMQRVGATDRRNRGEATVFAWADRNDAVAIIDDQSARRAAQQHGLEAHGSLWVMAKGVEHGRASVDSASNLADTLLQHGARYPFEVGGFRHWARCQGLLAA